MSSDESVSSRISQFGLYRTIDARTEEFLKLSRKRQIKQGCVCAAISTALTVTVVVTFLLIYEYNVIAKARSSSHKTNWLDLMNNSADDANLVEILNKEKIDVDKTTLKLLPVLLKALNVNNYIDKIEDEPERTIRNTPYEDVTTETTITKNIFADTRNWMKTTPSRLYAIEFKTSPIVYFKNPTRNVEYFTKIRKIRDYQRMLNYVDKMISEKNYLGTTLPMRNDYYYTEKPYKNNLPPVKHKPKQKQAKNQQTSPKTTMKEKEKQKNCKCSHKMTDLINKLLTNVQQLLSYFSGPSLKEVFRCKNNTSNEIKSLEPLIETSTVKNIKETITTKKYVDFKPKFTKSPSYNTFLNKHKYTIDTPSKGFGARRDFTVNAIMNLIKPNYKKYTEVDINFEPTEDYSTTNSYVETTDNHVILKESKNTHNNNTNVSTDAVTTVADYILQKGTYDVSSEVTSSLSTFSEGDFSDDDDDYPETTETKIGKILNADIKTPDIYNSEFVKNNLMSENLVHTSKKDKPYLTKGARFKQYIYNHIGPMRKVGNLAPKDKIESLFLPNVHRVAPIFNQSSYPKPILKTEKLSHKVYITSSVKPTRRTEATTIRNTEVTNTIISKVNNSKPYHITHFPAKEKSSKVQDENISNETALKHIEEAIMILKNETTVSQVENYDKIETDADTDQWEIVKEEESVTKSMLPLGRSTYLEMQRNDFKQEETHDFDNDLNYMFD